MNSELFIDILVKCFEFVGLTPIRVEVLDSYGNMRIGFKEGLKWQINQS